MSTISPIFEFNLEGFDNVVEAHNSLMAEAQLPAECVTSLCTQGVNTLNWPILKVTFTDLDSARAYTHAYLGCSDMRMVEDYLWGYV